MRTLRVMVVAILAALALGGRAHGAGGSYTFDGGTSKQRAQVRAALEASSFDWGLVPAEVTVHFRSHGRTYATPGHIWLNAELLSAGRFSWAIVQDEYAHQVDFFLFDAVTRARLTRDLGALDWCYGVPGLDHSQYGCERFASTLVWAYWPSEHNAYRPESPSDESAAMEAATFRALMAELIDTRASLRVQLSSHRPVARTRRGSTGRAYR